MPPRFELGPQQWRASMVAEIVPFTPRPRPLRADVPPFDPMNDAHLRAWESLWDLAKLEAGHER
jgi:hypothetical protein